MKRVLLLFIFSLGGCKSAPDDAIAAIFDHPGKKLSTYCLDIMGKDPAPEQLNHIRKFNRNVFSSTTCRQTESGYSTQSGRKAQMTIIVDIRRISPRTVEVDVDDISGFMFGSGGGTYTIEKLSGFWVVTGYEGTWIS